MPKVKCLFRGVDFPGALTDQTLLSHGRFSKKLETLTLELNTNFDQLVNAEESPFTKPRLLSLARFVPSYHPLWKNVFALMKKPVTVAPILGDFGQTPRIIIIRRTLQSIWVRLEGDFGPAKLTLFIVFLKPRYWTD